MLDNTQFLVSVTSLITEFSPQGTLWKRTSTLRNRVHLQVCSQRDSCFSLWTLVAWQPKGGKAKGINREAKEERRDYLTKQQSVLIADGTHLHDPHLYSSYSQKKKNHLHMGLVLDKQTSGVSLPPIYKSQKRIFKTIFKWEQSSSTLCRRDVIKSGENRGCACVRTAFFTNSHLERARPPSPRATSQEGGGLAGWRFEFCTNIYSSGDHDAVCVRAFWQQWAQVFKLPTVLCSAHEFFFFFSFSATLAWP